MIASPAASALSAFHVHAFTRGLVEAGQIAEHDLRLAQEVGRQNSQTLLRALLDLGVVGEDALAQRIAGALGCRTWSAQDEVGVISAAAPRRFMESTSLLLLEEPPVVDNAQSAERGPLRLVCVDPSDRQSIRSLLALLDGPVEALIGTQKDVQRFLAESDLNEQQGGEADAEALMDVSSEISQLRDLASEAPVIRFFNQAVERATELGASDLHFERYDHRVSLRYRVDGILVEQAAPPLNLFDPLLCRIKIMAGLDIAQRRLPQDGRIRMRLRGRMVDLRVSLVPTMYGQDAAIRIQDRQRLGEIRLSDLGFSPEHVSWLESIARKSHGILLITGPTGSGKTTSLYALLRTLVGGERKIITVEDPVEYAMEGVNQIPVNPSIGLNFANTLRHILRHDPDVILIGEIRDAETAQIAFQAALTGHMVLSTLHTNDVPGTFVRLIDMGVEPYLVNAAVEGVTAQRLIRRVCVECRNERPRVEGCRACGGLGYRGRVSVMERSGLTAPVKRAVAEGADERRVREALAESGFAPMRVHAEALVREGVTDMAEVVRVLGHNGAAGLDAEPARAVASAPQRGSGGS